MSAIKKSDPNIRDENAEQDQTPAPASLEDVADKPDVEAADSPARAMQQLLEQSMQPEPQHTRLMDTGRILASASGITMLLGVFIFSGIW